MRFTLFALLALCLIAACRSAEEEYDYEEEPAAAPVTPAPAKPAGRLGGLLSPRGRGPIGRKPAATPSTTTAKPVEEAVEDEELSEEAGEEGQEQEKALTTTTTTESSKKLRGGVRPFRSNEDLLAALKRRRAQVGSSHSRDTATPQASADPTTPKPRASTNGRRGGSTAETTPARTGRGRFGTSRASKAAAQEEVEETQQEEVQVKPRAFRKG